MWAVLHKFYLFIVISIAILLHGCGERDKTETADLVIKNVSLFDSESGNVRLQQSIFVKDGFVSDIKPSSPSDSAETVIEGNGRLASPGLIDTHVHFTHQFHPSRTLIDQDRERLARVYLTHGVTTIADMGQPPLWVPKLAEWEKSPKADSPDIVLVAGSLNSVHDWDQNPPLHHILLASPEDARAKVREYHDKGAKRLKLYWKLEQPEMAAIIDEADRLGVSYFGHIDNGFMSIGEAMDEGVRHFEHFFTLQRSVADPDDLIPLIAENFPFDGPDSLDEWTLSLVLYHNLIENTPELKTQLDNLLKRLAENNVTISTSLNTLATAGNSTPVLSFFDPKPPRFSPNIRESFIPEGIGEDAFETVIQQVKRAHDLGVTLRIGTDARNGGEVTLAEMKLLAEAGIPVSEVLQIATLNGAKSLGLSETAGQIAVGRAADIVLFDQSPFEDPANFLAGVTTVKNGVVYAPSKSTAEILYDLLTTNGIDAATQYWDARQNTPLHPGEFQDVFLRLNNDGRIEEARYIAGLLPEMLSGENISAYAHLETMNLAGQTLLGNGEIDKGVALFELASDLHASDWLAQLNMGAVYSMAGRPSDAEKAFERALALDPENETIKNTIQSIYESQSQSE